MHDMQMMAPHRHTLLVGLAVIAFTGAASAGPDVGVRAVAPAAPLEAEESHTIQIFEKTAPSVVFIVNSALIRRLFSRNVYEVPQGAGSGFVWNPQGYIVTNFHVVYNADSLTVVLADQTEHEARVVGVDPDHDLAVLQIQVAKEKLAPIVGTTIWPCCRSRWRGRNWLRSSSAAPTI
jgi:S1-C subfamily serine protease